MAQRLHISDFPLLLKEYSSKNVLPASKVLAGTGKKLWWKCSKCSHEWQVVGYSRVAGNGCPACAGRVPTFNNNMAITHPKLAKEFSLERNFPLTPNKVIAGTGKKLWWRCSKCRDEWQTTGNKRINGSGCPACANQVVTPSNNLAFLYPLLALEYSSLNKLPANRVIPTTGQVLIWQCQKCGEQWRTSGAHRVKDGTGCPVCAHKAAVNRRRKGMVSQKSSFAKCYPGLVEDYSPKLNKLPPDEYLPLNDDIIWWQCHDPACGKSWQARLSTRISSNDIGCPNCYLRAMAGKKAREREKFERERAEIQSARSQGKRRLTKTTC